MKTLNERKRKLTEDEIEAKKKRLIFEKIENNKKIKAKRRIMNGIQKASRKENR